VTRQNGPESGHLHPKAIDTSKKRAQINKMEAYEMLVNIQTDFILLCHDGAKFKTFFWAGV
jgi:hypothetical protein